MKQVGKTTFLDLNQTIGDGRVSREYGNDQEVERKWPLSIVKLLAAEEKHEHKTEFVICLG